MNIGSRLVLLRKAKKLTQKELADKLHVSDKTISSYEMGRTKPDLNMIVRLSEILECNISELIYGKNEKSDIETEIKIKLTKKEYDVLDVKMLNKAKFIKEMRQIDTYYEPTYRKFLTDDEIKEWLRIGKRDGKTILNYKHWYDNKYCDEYEVEVDDANNLDKIFKILGLVEIAVVAKKRKTYLYLDKYEVALDEVKDLGYFVEIEVKKYDTDKLKEYDELIKLACDLDLNLDKIDKRGYPYHIIYKDK